MSNLHHAIKLRNGTVIYIPSSIPNVLLPFIDTKHLIKDKDLTDFKRLIEGRDA